MSVQVVGIIGAAAVLAVMVELLRRRQLREKYAALWLLVGLAVLALALFPGMLAWVAVSLGFEVPANFLFLVALILLLGVTVHLSWELSRVEEETRTLAEDVGILRLEVDRLLGQAGGGGSAEGGAGQPMKDKAESLERREK